MSGHSKWATIHKQKSVTDAKRGAVFTKLARNITIAAREKGGDSEMNMFLRTAIDKAKEFNMPKDNIERAIKKGTGELEGAKIEEIVYEGFGPEGTALIIKCLSDNKNRTVANIRHILTKHNGRLGEVNTVMWMFEEKGVIRFLKSAILEKGIGRDNFELEIIDAGAEDIKEEDAEVEVYTNVQNFQNIKDVIEKKGIKVESSGIEWIAKNNVEVVNEAREKVINLLEALDDDEDVQDVYINGKNF
ncbi:MAG: YebC/PmpR family DNA-binding transcriptional regulator [bacterium]